MARRLTNLKVFNLAQIGVDVDTDNMHTPVGGFRAAQNIHRNTAESIITRRGIRSLNNIMLGSGAVLGGVVIPSFEAGNGTSSMFLGFGD